MFLKLLLVILFLSMLVAGLVTRQTKDLSPSGESIADNKRLRLMTWNVGYGDLESDSRAHTSDLPEIAKTILEHDPYAIALQELTGQDQLNALKKLLGNRYLGQAAQPGSSDRIDAILVKDRSAKFQSIKAGDAFTIAATFRKEQIDDIVLMTAHADAFSSVRRRTFATEIVDWARLNNPAAKTFIAGDFNLEVSVRNRTNLFTDDAKHDSESYAYLLKYFRDLGNSAGVTSINDRRIDYIFGPSNNVVLHRAEVLRSAAVGGMDHWPLLIDVSF